MSWLKLKRILDRSYNTSLIEMESAHQ